jgi:hypothetical protein
MPQHPILHDGARRLGHAEAKNISISLPGAHTGFYVRDAAQARSCNILQEFGVLV